MGPEGVSIPPGSQDLGSLGKNVSDLIDNLELSFEGNTVKVSGNVKNIKTAWKEFDSSGNTGHFVPIKLPAECANRDITFKGKSKDSTIHIDDDLLLVIRMENLTGLTATIELDGEVLLKLDFTALVPVGSAAHDSAKKDFGNYGTMEMLTEDINISWDGVNGTVTGKLKNYTEGASKLTNPGHYFPLSTVEWFDNVPKKVGINNIKNTPEKDIVLTVSSTEKPIMVEYQGMTVMKLDLTNVTLL